MALFPGQEKPSIEGKAIGAYNMDFSSEMDDDENSRQTTTFTCVPQFISIKRPNGIVLEFLHCDVTTYWTEGV